MNPPRRWVEDPEAEDTLRSVLSGAPRARPLDPWTRRRLGAKVARASALPVAAAGWLFVKSAAAGLTMVLGSGAVAVATGVVEWQATPVPQAAPLAPRTLKRAPSLAASPHVAVEAPMAEPALEREEEPRPQLNPTPSLPIAPSASTLSAEVALLERARRQMHAAPAVALAFASKHAAQFPRGQLSSERTLIQIEALLRLGRDAEARRLGSALVSGTSPGLYAERVRQLLGGTPAK